MVDVLHGIAVADPYRWLEDGDSDETRAWVALQNDVTRTVLSAIPWRDPIHASLDALFSIGLVGPPSIRGERYFYQRRDA